MKKIIFLLFAFISLNVFSQTATSAKQDQQITEGLAQGKTLDTLRQELSAIRLKLKYAEGKLDSINASVKTYTNDATFTQDTLFKSQARIWTELDSIRQGNLKRIRIREDSLQNGLTRVQNSVTYLSNLTRYNNNKQDSMITSQTYTTMSFTVSSVSTATASVAGHYLGVGVYSITIPTGNWQVMSVICTQSVGVSTNFTAIHFFQGPLNYPAVANDESQVFNVTSALGAEWISSYTGATSFNSNGATAMMAKLSVTGFTGMFTMGEILSSGTLKIAVMYGSSATPAANAQYMYRIRLKRVN